MILLSSQHMAVLKKRKIPISFANILTHKSVRAINIRLRT
jgi:hypothetical protein